MGYRISLVRKSDFGVMAPPKEEVKEEPKVEEKPKVEVPKSPEQKSTDELSQTRVDLEKQKLTAKEELAKLKQSLEKGYAELQKLVDFEEPELHRAIRELEDWKNTIDGWTIRIKKIEGYDVERSKEILDYLEKKTKKLNPRVYHLIRTVRNLPKHNTPVPYTEYLEVKPDKTPTKTNRPKKAGMVLTAEEESYWNQLKSWFKRTFTPLWADLREDFNELKDLLIIEEVEE